MSSVYNKLILLLILLFPVIVYLIPINYIEANPAPCLYRILFNMECIGCGITRACINAIHFNFEKALEYNKLVVIVLPLCIICYINFLYKFFIKWGKYK